MVQSTLLKILSILLSCLKVFNLSFATSRLRNFILQKKWEELMETHNPLITVSTQDIVDAMVQRSRARGLLVGASARTKLKTGYFLTRLEYLRRVSDIHDNDIVVTSGLDGVFPPGLPVGTIHNITKSQDGIFKEAEVVPFENFQELQEVMVLLYN